MATKENGPVLPDGANRGSRSTSKDFLKQPLTFNIYIGDGVTQNYWKGGRERKHARSTRNGRDSFKRKALEQLHQTCCMCMCCCLTMRSEINTGNALEENSDDRNSSPSGDNTTATFTLGLKRVSPTEMIKQYNITLDDFNDWFFSFDHLMECPSGVQVFKHFCESEFSDENIKFWQAVQNFEMMKNATVEEQKRTIKQIYNEYISVSAMSQVSLTHTIQQDIQKKMEISLNQTKRNSIEMSAVVPIGGFQESPLLEGAPELNTTKLRVTMTSSNPDNDDDSRLRVLRIQDAELIFKEAMHHVYNIMKRDIYTRFRNSELMANIRIILEAK